MLDLNEQKAREKAIQFAMDNNRLEGLEIEQEVLELSREWASGNIHYRELQEKVYAIYGI